MQCEIRDTALKSTVEIALAIRRGALSSSEMLERFISRVNQFNPSLNAIIAMNLEPAQELARRADEALLRGEIWGALHGIPMTIKDSFEVCGMPTTSGAPKLENYQPTRNATAAQRLIDSGAIIFGKTNLPIYADDVQTYNEVYGTTNNPWDVSRSPGGSSGGGAAALAAGLTPLELGSDIGGSVRNPAHFCGVYGHKSTWGIIPTRGHIPPPPGTRAPLDLMVAGPMARYPEDLLLAFELIAGAGDLASLGWKLDLPGPQNSAIANYRVATWLDDPACPVDSEVLDILGNAIDMLAHAGVIIVDNARPIQNLAESHELYLQLLYAVYGAAYKGESLEMQIQQATEFPDSIKYSDRFARGATQRHGAWMRANEKRVAVREQWQTFFDEFDVLLTPVMPTAAFPHNQEGSINKRTFKVNGQDRPYLDQLTWAGMVSLVHLPATVVPIGLTRSGLPVGMQIIGPYMGDRTTLDFACHMANIVGGFVAPPGYDL